VLFNGSFVGQDEFSPTRYKPVVTAVYSKKSIVPQNTGFTASAAETDIIVDLHGVAGIEGQCKAQLPDAIVKLSNTIVPDSGSHNHFTMDTEIGAGAYLPQSVNDVLNPDISGTLDTVIEGKIDIYGLLYTKYKAGIYGLQENVTVEARREKTELHNEIKSEPFSYKLDIKVPNLTPLATDKVDYKLLGSYKVSSICDDTAHNNSSTDRRSHYLTSNALIGVTSTAKLYKTNTQGMLSFNDASLAFGGFFDKGTLNRDEACHVSHRKGIDIDINSIDSKGRDIWFDNFTGINGNYSILFFELERYAKFNGGIRVPERGSIHYRFSK